MDCNLGGYMLKRLTFSPYQTPPKKTVYLPHAGKFPLGRLIGLAKTGFPRLSMGVCFRRKNRYCRSFQFVRYNALSALS